MSEKSSVAIIGGGWAGLAAAAKLSAEGHAVTLFEAARQLGGRARAVESQHGLLDNGQHILIGAYQETLQLLNTVGVDIGQAFRRLPLSIVFPRAPFALTLPELPAPLHLAAGLIGAKGVKFSEKISAIRFMRALQKQDYRLAEDVSVKALLDRYGQHGSLRQFLWEPLCYAALNTRVECASAQIFANVLQDSLGGSREATDVLLPARNLTEIFPSAAAKFIERHQGKIVLSARIEAIERNNETGALSVHGEAFDHVVIATAPQHAAKLLIKHPALEESVRKIADFTYEPIGTVYLGYPHEVGLPRPMLGMSHNEPGYFGQWAFDRGQLGDTAGTIAVVMSANGAWDQLDNTALCSAIHAELQELLNVKLPAPMWQQVIRERRATFSCRPKLLRPDTQTPIKGIWLTGDYVGKEYPATLESAVRSALATARLIQQAHN